MLTLGQQVVVESFAKEFVKLIRDAIKNKPIKRVSRRKVKGKYIDKVFSSPVNASGELARTIRYEITDKGLSIWANDYIYDLVYGKAPSLSASGNDHNLESKIRNWMSDKGISSTSINDDTLGQLITNKIQKFGSSIYLAHHGKNSGLLENILSEQLITQFNTKFTIQLEQDLKAAFNGQ